MGLLDSLLAGGAQQQDYQEFISRYDQGPPDEGVSEQEAYLRHQEVAAEASPELYQRGAEQAFARLLPDQRLQLGQQLFQEARAQGVNLPDVGGGSPASFGDSSVLAQLAGGLHQQQPGLLGNLLGGGSGLLGGGQGAGGLRGNPAAKAALAGIAAMVARRVLQGH